MLNNRLSLNKNNISHFRALATASEAITKHPFPSPNINWKRNQNRFNTITAIVRLLVKILVPVEHEKLHGLLSDLISWCDTHFSTDQPGFAKLSSQLHNMVKVVCLSTDLNNSFFSTNNVHAISDAPFELIEIINLIHDPKYKDCYHSILRVLFTILDMHKVTQIPTPPSLSSITDKFSGTDESGGSINVGDCLRMLGVIGLDTKASFEREIKEHELHATTAAGPNGHGLWAATHDAIALRRDERLWNTLISFIQELNLPMLENRLNGAWSVFSYVGGSKVDEMTLSHSRLHLLQEKSTKSRVIAIGDYFTQSALRPIHNVLAGILRDISQDCTFDQKRGFEEVKKLSLSGHDLYSLDLSKATDRIPVKFLERVIAEVFKNKNLAVLWRKLLTDREFLTSNGHTVRYTVGQPMGFLSSFSIMALAHHIIVMAAAKAAGHSIFSRYCILGDDLVICEKGIKDKYIEIMKSLGVEISEGKSIFSDEKGGAVRGAEFCKRLVINGVEVTGLPVNSIVDCLSDDTKILGLWDILMERKIFKGVEIYDFFSIFLSEKNLTFLIQMNYLPSEVSGIRNPLPAPEAKEFTEEHHTKEYGFNFTDVVNAYYFVILSESIAHIDGIAKRAASAMGVLDIELDTMPTDLEGQGIPQVKGLIEVMRSKLKFLDSSGDLFVHPVQDVIFNTSKRLVSMLSSFNTSGFSIKDVQSMKNLDIFSNILSKRATVTGNQDPLFGDRRKLAKAFEVISKALKNKDSPKELRYIGKIGANDSLWTVRLVIGGELSVYPSIRKLAVNKDLASVKLKSVVSGKNELGKLFPKEPS